MKINNKLHCPVSDGTTIINFIFINNFVLKGGCGSTHEVKGLIWQIIIITQKITATLFLCIFLYRACYIQNSYTTVEIFVRYFQMVDS